MPQNYGTKSTIDFPSQNQEACCTFRHVFRFADILENHADDYSHLCLVTQHMLCECTSWHAGLTNPASSLIEALTGRKLMQNGFNPAQWVSNAVNGGSNDDGNNGGNGGAAVGAANNPDANQLQNQANNW